MSNTTSSITAVTAQRHGDQYWQPQKDMRYASTLSTVPIVGLEASRAALCMPIAFVQQGDHVGLVAVTGLQPGKNVFVGPDGRWLARYVPALLRAFPFSLLPTDSGELALAVDEGAITPNVSPQRERFYTNGGDALAPLVQETFRFLANVYQNHAATLIATAQLKACGLLQSWPITIQSPSGSVDLQGLMRIDEQAFSALDGDRFLGLRENGALALALAYAQIMSSSQLEVVGELASAHENLDSTARSLSEAGELDLSFLSGDTLKL